MSPELYFAVMLITNSKKARRILLAEELENWFMDLFDDEFEDVLDGTFKDNQEVYIDRIIDKYLEMTGVSITATDEYSKSVIDRAVKMAGEIQDTTWRNLTVPYLRRTKKSRSSASDMKKVQGTSQRNVQVFTQGGSSQGFSTNQNSVAQGIGQEYQEITQGFYQDSDIYRLEDFIREGIAIGATLFATDTIRRWLGQERANIIALNEANWRWNNEEFFEAKKTKKTKTWHTALDEKVRMAHVAMEGVTIPVDEPFHVGASLMMYPTDSSMGASINELANCRCTVSFK